LIRGFFVALSSAWFILMILKYYRKIKKKDKNVKSMVDLLSKSYEQSLLDNFFALAGFSSNVLVLIGTREPTELLSTEKKFRQKPKKKTRFFCKMTDFVLFFQIQNQHIKFRQTHLTRAKTYPEGFLHRTTLTLTLPYNKIKKMNEKYKLKINQLHT
jgi:hypothetical protein